MEATTSAARKLHLDVESCSEVELSDVGVHVYFAHPSTRLLCACWAYETGPVHTWLYGAPPPDDLCQAIELGFEMRAFNASFEIQAMRMMHERHAWPAVPDTAWRCVRAKASAFAIPDSLGKACAAMGVEHQKDQSGHRVMLQLCKPCSATKNDPNPWRLHTPERLDILYAYCAQDVEAERSLDASLPDLTPEEHAVWFATQRLNDLGVRVDREAVGRALALLDASRVEWARQIQRFGGPDVGNVAAIKGWLAVRGVPVDSLDKDAVTDLLADPSLADDVRLVLQARQNVGKTSLAKLPVLAESCGADGRLRGCFTYHGATTGRWTSQRAQLQNIPRDGLPDTDAIMADLSLPLDEFSMLWGDPFAVLSRCLKGFFVAPEGKVLVAGDLKQIEARVVLWLAGDPGLKRLADGAPVYEEVAAETYGCPISEIGTKRRFVGKTTFLAGIYGQGAKTHNAKLAQARVILPMEVSEAAVKAFRAKFAAVPKWWRALEQAAVMAVKSPGMVMPMDRGVKFRMTGKHLQCRLPSGRKITWPFAETAIRPTPWGEMKDAVTFMEENRLTHQWGREDTYSGKLAENVASGVARDLMAAAMLACPEHGWTPVATVHDEAVAEADDTTTLVDDFQKVLCTAPAWAAGLPIAAECWKGPRYG